MSDKESIIINLDNIDTNTKETEELRWRLQEEAYEKIKELFKEYNGKMTKEPQDISECRTRNTALIVGGRGSGKTYFLLNISKYLKDNVKEELNKRPFADNFHFFAPIDPTLLHKNENFLTVILAKILNELEKRKCDEKLSDEAKREFYEKLNKVAEAIDGFDGERKNAFQIISSDQSGLRLEQYIHEFFELVSKTLGNKQLVLLIDDVDMAFEKGYEVLETVRKYLASPYVISVVTGDMCLYERIIHKEFADNLSLKQKELDGYMEEGAERICREGKKEFLVKLTDDYLGKLFEYKARAKLKSFKELSGHIKESGRENAILLKLKDVEIYLQEYRESIEKSIATRVVRQKIFEEFSLRKFLSFAKETITTVIVCKNEQNSQNQELVQKKIFDLSDLYSLGASEADNYFELGRQLSAGGDSQKAKEAYLKAIEINPEYTLAYNNLGIVYINTKNYDKAIEALKKAIEINPKYALAYNNLGNAYGNKQEYDKAIEAYQKVIEIIPKYDAAYYNLGVTYSSIQEYDKAIEAYEKVIEINPKDDKAYSNLGNAYDDKQEYDKAIEAYQKAIEINPKYDAAYNNLGNAYNYKKEYNKAIEACQKAIEINPKYDAAYYNLGIAYYGKEEYDKAIEAFQKAIEINPKDDAAYNNLGIAYGNKQEYDKAIEFFQKAIEINPKNGVTYVNLLELQLIHKNNMSSEVVKSFKENIEDKEFLKQFGMLKILQNLKDEASIEEEFGRWKEEFEGTKATWVFDELDDWAETLEEGKKELIKKAIEAFKPYFNN